MHIDSQFMDLIQGMIYLENGQTDLAETNFRKVVENNPAHPRALLFMAQTLTMQREYDEAGIYFELAQLYPEVRYDAYYAHAQLLLGLERRDEALEKLRQAQSVEGSDELSEIIRSLDETGRLVR